MATTLYKSDIWHVQSFGTELVTSIAQFDTDGDISHVWIIDNKDMAARFAYVLETCVAHDDAPALRQGKLPDAFLMGFTMASQGELISSGKQSVRSK